MPYVKHPDLPNGTPMTAEEYYDWLFRTIPWDQIPAETIQAGWHDYIKSDLADFFERYISKNGKINIRREYAELIERTLTKTQLVELYILTRNSSPHRELELLQEYQRLFPKCLQDLPG